MYILTASTFCSSCLCGSVIPETKGKTLETIDSLFGGVNHADKGANMIE